MKQNLGTINEGIPGPIFNIGDTVVLKRRWTLWFKDWVLCEVMAGYYSEIMGEWRYTLKMGSSVWYKFCLGESEIISKQLQ